MKLRGGGEKLLVEFVEIVRILHEFITFTIPYSSFAFFPPFPLLFHLHFYSTCQKSRYIYTMCIYVGYTFNRHFQREINNIR